MEKVIQKIPFISFRTELGFNEAVLERWNQALHNSQFIAGKALNEFQSMLLDFTKASYFIPCANGTDAIQIALRALGITSQDNVLLPDFTFWATYEAIINVGANPIMIDISPNDYQMDFDLCIQAIEKYKPKAIILVHLYGWCSARLQEFRDLCQNKNIYLIEDGAQAMGSKYESKPIFQESFVATTSFYPAKVLGAAGDAGGIFCKNRDLADKCLQLGNHGRSSHYGYDYVGWNSRLDELQAHFLCESLKRLPDRIKSRQETEKKYFDFITKQEQNTNFPLEVKQAPIEVQSNGYLQVSISKTNFCDLSTQLLKFGIVASNIYPSPISTQKGSLKPITHISKDNIAIEISQKIINLPLFPYMIDEEINYVCKALIDISNPENTI